MLVRDIETVRNYIEAQKSVLFTRFEAIIRSVEENIVQDLLNGTLYDDLNTYIDGGESGTPHYDVLLSKVRGAIVNLTFHNGYDLFNVKNTESGFKRIDADHTSDPYIGQERRLRKMFQNEGYNGLDRSLKYIEDNIGLFSNWGGLTDRDIFVFRTIDFDEIYDIRTSRLVFLKTVPVQRTSQEMHLRSVLQSTLFDTLLTEVKNDSLSTENAALLPHVQRAAAWWAVYEGGIPLQEYISERMFAVSGSAPTYDMRDDFRAYNENVMNKLLEDAKRKAQLWTTRLTDFLEENAEDYGYTPSTSVSDWDFSNDDLDKTVLL